MRQQDLYTELGKLLYAIVNADGNIRKSERATLQELLRNEFIPNEKQVDEFGVNKVFYAEYEFDWLEEKSVHPKEAFASFIRFIKSHSKDIDAELKTAILNIAEKVAASFHGINRFEKHYLHRLEEELKTI